MKFRIIDLLALTAIGALLAVGFKEDLTFFRQFLWFVMVTIGSTAFVLLFTIHQRRQGIWGGMGGLMGGLIFLGFDWTIIMWFFDQLASNVRFLNTPTPFNVWSVVILPVVVVSPLLGSAVGPLTAIRLRQVNLPTEFIGPVRFSGLLAGFAVLLSVFAMTDRIAMYGLSRDWIMLIVLMIALFVVYTHHWLGRWEKRMGG